MFGLDMMAAVSLGAAEPFVRSGGWQASGDLEGWTKSPNMEWTSNGIQQGSWICTSNVIAFLEYALPPDLIAGLRIRLSVQTIRNSGDNSQTTLQYKTGSGSYTVVTTGPSGQNSVTLTAEFAAPDDAAVSIKINSSGGFVYFDNWKIEGLA